MEGAAKHAEKRQRLVRALITEIVVDIDAVAACHPLEGGQHTEMRLRKPRTPSCAAWRANGPIAQTPNRSQPPRRQTAAVRQPAPAHPGATRTTAAESTRADAQPLTPSCRSHSSRRGSGPSAPRSGRGARPAAIRPMSRGAACPAEPPTEANQPQTRCTASCLTPIQRSDRRRTPAHQISKNAPRHRATSCIITARVPNLECPKANQY
jgi:hypothetical protein